MEQVSIPTTQNVPLDYEVASLGDRMLATLIDYGVFLGYGIVGSLIASIIGGAGLMNDPWFAIFFWTPALLYDLFLEWLCNGQSVGKMAMKIRVVKIDGTRPSIGSFMIRQFLRIVDSGLWFWTFGSFTILATGTGQRLGDLAANTTVIRTKRPTRIYDTILHRIDPNYIPAFPSVAKLTDRDIATIKDVMIMCAKTRNWDGLSALAKKVKEVMEVDPKIPDFQFLNIVIKDYTNTHQ